VNVTFHCAASIGVAHMISRPLVDAASMGWLRNTGIAVSAFLLGVLSHGVLDGLLHQYPVPLMIDPLAAVAVLAIYCCLVQHRFRLLFILTFTGAVLPDVIDLGTAIANRLLGSHLPTPAEWLGFRLPAGHFFPWHWPEGSGSIFGGSRLVVSLTNHIIVMSFVLAAIWTTERFLSGPHRDARQSRSVNSEARASTN
jgi:hypothetical protein